MAIYQEKPHYWHPSSWQLSFILLCIFGSFAIAEPCLDFVHVELVLAIAIKTVFILCFAFYYTKTVTLLLFIFSTKSWEYRVELSIMLMRN